MTKSNNIIGDIHIGDLPYAFKWQNLPKSLIVEQDKLIVEAGSKKDFYIAPDGSKVKDNAPFLYMETGDDFRISVKITVDFIEPCDSGCIMLMEDEKNWAKLCYEYINAIPTIVSVVTKGVSDDAISMKSKGGSIYLCAVKKGNAVAFHYSEDNENWKLVRFFGMEPCKSMKIGLVTQSPFSDEARVTYESLKITEGITYNPKLLK